MAITRIAGTDGSVTMPAGTHDGALSAWSVTADYPAFNVTAFGDTVQRNRIGKPLYSGTATGVPVFDASNTSPGFDAVAAGGSALTLQAATGCTLALTAGFTQIGLSSNFTQNSSGLSFAFVNGDNDTVTLTWDESA